MTSIVSITNFLEAILIRFRRQFLSHLLVAGLLAPAALAGSKEDPHDLLTKSFQQADIWAQAPVKLMAAVRMPGSNGQDLNLNYTVSWAGADKWRAEWSTPTPGLDVVTVLNNGKLSSFSNSPSPLLRAFPFEAAIAMLDGGNPAGPYSFPPLDYQKAKLDVTKKKINNVDAKCMAFGMPIVTLCVDPASSHLLSAESELGSFEYSDYATVGANSYPQSIKVSYAKTLMAEGKLTVTPGEKFADAVFLAPEKSTSVDFATCADVGKNFTAPHLSKSAPPKMTDAMKTAKKYGMVWTLATVGKDGSVEKVEVIGGDPDLTPAAKDAVQAYKYNAYMRCGQAVQFTKVVVVPFMPTAPKKPQDDIIETGK